ncbi:MAG: carboxypeptidase M32 [Planctomycetota bacterium]|nr:carboxypeptidase M32 [Planctomycetota bacterium]
MNQTASDSAAQDPAIVELRDKLRGISLLQHAVTTLEWDQETHMPTGGAESRAAALGELVGISHKRSQDPALGDCIGRAEEVAQASGDADLQALMREVRYDYDQSVRIPARLATEISESSSRAVVAWRSAREKDDFPCFEPLLKKQIELHEQYADCLQDGNSSRYDILMNLHERGMTAQSFDEICQQVVPGIRNIIERATENPTPEPSFMKGPWDTDKQLSFARDVAAELGYDFERGAIDLTAHPFCISPSAPHDVRITTRVSTDDFIGNLFGVIHEAGHAMYEQGLDPAWEHTPLCDSISLGIHESQSRFWENDIARGEAFWGHFLPKMQNYFPEQLSGVNAREMAAAVNPVRPSLIRTEADEVTYGLHIALRFELEKGMFDGSISTSDLPGLWREKMREYLGIEPENDREGVLQDIHWSFGLFGYFPTYLLGSVYSAQFYQAIGEQIDIDTEVAAGRFGSILEWLQTRVHRPGRRKMPQELLEDATGHPLDPTVMLASLDRKVEMVHGV